MSRLAAAPTPRLSSLYKNAAWAPRLTDKVIFQNKLVFHIDNPFPLRVYATLNPPAPLDLTISASTGKNFVPFLRKHLLRAHAGINLRPPLVLRELSLALVGDKKMSDLHARYLNVAGPTDVLTFPIDEDPRGRALSGEVVICVPEAMRQCKSRGVEPRLELLLYALHGMLHLAGFDDRTDRDFAAMHRTEDLILKRLGFEPIFHHRPRRIDR